MGRPPCCDKMGVKKGPWTPEEDIMLVTYVQQHGPGNWRQVPTNTGLRRCSKSCRLRWTNYLRPGIRRGDFTEDEEKMIIQLQALLGNKWAAIASYLPERTDNDIKNYWNTHLKKKLRKLQMGTTYTEHDHHNQLINPNGNDGNFSSSSTASSSSSHYRGQWERRLQTDIHMAKQALNDALSLDKPSFLDLDHYTSTPPQNPTTTTAAATSKTSAKTTTYASSTENIAKLLKGFMKNTPKINASSAKSSSNSSTRNSNSNSNSSTEELNIPGGVESKSTTGINLSEAFESLFGFDQSFGSPNNSDFSQSNTSPEGSIFQGESKPELPLTMFESWLLEEAGGSGLVHGEGKPTQDLTNFGFDEHPDFFDN